MSEKIKQRQLTFAGPLKIREAGDGEKSRVIEGYALLFGVRSQLLADWYDAYYEVLEPGCIDRETLDECDIKMTMFHNREKILARSNRGEGTLSYEVDDKGVKFSFEAPNTAFGDEALELVARGDLAGCSFIYSTNEDPKKGSVSYERTDEEVNGESIILRRVHKIERVYDFTIAADPAYTETSVSRREVEAFGITFGDSCKEEPADVKEELAKAREQVASMRQAVKQFNL